ncbi:MAG TPA: hypothetical protein VIJ21_09320 [Solirubrobacterales bacterium]
MTGPSEVAVSRTVAAVDADLFDAVAERDSAQPDFWPQSSTGADVEVAPEFVFGLMSSASTRWCSLNGRTDALSYGYDEVTLGVAVRIGDTLTARYVLHPPARPEPKIYGRVTVHNQDGDLVASARHTLWQRIGTTPVP